MKKILISLLILFLCSTNLFASRKGWKNGCIEFLHGVGHTPPDGHDCLYANTLHEFHIIHSGGEDYLILDSSLNRACLTKSADQTVNSSTWTSISFNQEDYDVGALHDNSTNNTRITITRAGEYEIIYHVKHDAMDKTSYETRIYKNNSAVIEGTCDVAVGSKDTSYTVSKITSKLITFAIGDYIELQFYHDDDETQDVLSNNTFFAIRQIY